MGKRIPGKWTGRYGVVRKDFIACTDLYEGAVLKETSMGIWQPVNNPEVAWFISEPSNLKHLRIYNSIEDFSELERALYGI